METTKKVICFDFDDVIPKSNSVSKIMKIFGKRLKILGIGMEFIEDNMDPKRFFKAVKDIVALLKDMEYEKIKKFMLRFGLSEGTKEVMKKMKELGHKIVIISTNDERFIKEYLIKYGIDIYVDHVYASRFGVKNGLLTGKVSGDVIKTEKTGIVKKVEKLYRVKKKNIVYIGDGLTDLPIMKMVGTSILFCPNNFTKAEVFLSKTFKERLKKGDMFIVEKRDLKEIMKFI